MANNWTGRTTIPKEPNLSYKRSKSKGQRRVGSVERGISKELMARNISLENIQTQSYQDDDSYQNFHQHYYQDDSSELMVPNNMSLEQLRNRDLLTEKMLENNTSWTSGGSHRNHSQREIVYPQVKKQDFSKSSSNLERIHKVSIALNEPENTKVGISKSF